MSKAWAAPQVEAGGRGRYIGTGKIVMFEKLAQPSHCDLSQVRLKYAVGTKGNVGTYCSMLPFNFLFDILFKRCKVDATYLKF